MNRRRHRNDYSPYRSYSGSTFSSIFGNLFGYNSTSTSPFSIFGNYQPLQTKKILVNGCGVDILLAYPFILINGLIKINLNDDGLKLYNSLDSDSKLEIIGVDVYDI